MFGAYVFEAKKLQSFIFETSKLRDASGASELVSALAFEVPDTSGISNPVPGDRLSGVLDASGLTDENSAIHRRTGGVVSLVADDSSRDKLELFRALWRLDVVGFAPGLEFQDGLAKGESSEDALKKAYQAVQSSQPPNIAIAPSASPLVRLAPRSGRAPVPNGAGIKDTKCKITGEFIDAATQAKRQFLKKGNLNLPRLFVGADAKNYQWPLRFDGDEGEEDEAVFPFPTDAPHRLAIIHVDGNGVGQMFMQATAKLKDGKARALSLALAQATQDAVQQAMKAAVLPHALDKVVPARPVLIGGDDLTIVLRADLAVDFVTHYITAFEAKTKTAFAKFPDGDLPSGLHAKAGIVFLGVRQPFSQGYALCESLATTAKHADQSRVSFFRLTSAFIPPDAADIRQNRPNLWREAWGLGELKKLKTLAELLTDDDVGHGAMRRVPDLLAQGMNGQATAVYARALTVLKKRNADVHENLVEALKGFGLNATSPVDANGYSPLLDAHDLGQITPASKAEEPA